MPERSGAGAGAGAAAGVGAASFHRGERRINLGGLQHFVRVKLELLGHHDLGQAVLHIVVRGRRAIARVLQLDHVPAGRGLHRGLGEFTLLQRGDRVGERRIHVARPEPAEVATFGRGRGVGRQSLGQSGEVIAGLELRDDLHRDVLAAHLDVTRLEFDQRRGGDLRLELGAHLRVRRGVLLHVLLRGRLLKHLEPAEREARRDFRIVQKA